MDRVNKLEDSTTDNKLVSTVSKQSSYYNKNKKSINRKRRKKYKLDKESKDKVNKNRVKNLKPNDIKNSVFSSKINSINQLYNSLNKEIKGTEPENKAILCFNDLVAFAQNQLLKDRDTQLHQRIETTKNFALPEIVSYVGLFQEQSFSELELQFKDKLSTRQLKRALELLVNLKWLIRLELEKKITVYRLNPFLEALKDIDNGYLLLGEYARFKIDFFDLLNLPLINVVSSSQKIVNAKVKFHEYKLGNHASWVRAFFEGYVHITLTVDNGNIYESFLPVNKHASSKIIGYNHERKKRITDPYGFLHHTLPLKWSLFDVLESSEYAKGCTYVHFDNSIKIIYYDNDFQYLMFRKPFEKLLRDKWSVKNQSCQYIEVSDLDLLQRLFNERFVNNKRRKDLFDALGIKYKAKKRKRAKSKS